MTATTAAKSLTTAATLFAGPGSANNATPAVNDSATFHFVLDGTVQTLSTQNTPDTGPIKGLLFVPSLSPLDPCNNTTAPFVPANATRLPDVQRFGYQTIGLAPWVSDDCTKAYLNASGDAGSDALVFFVPSSNDTKPPGPDDPSWLLDGDDGWKSRAPFPVYAIPGTAGATLMQQLASYSGNHSDSAADANATSFLQAPTDIRLFTLIDLDRGDKKMPSLWGFILAIVGTILVLSILLLLCYQLVQKRRRENLQRRIEAGEADIENLGLHQLKVPQEVLDSIPVYTYPDVDALSDKSSHARCADVASTRSTDEIRELKDDRDDSSHCTASVCPPDDDRSKPPTVLATECPKPHDDASEIQADITPCPCPCPCPAHPNLTTSSLPTDLQPAARHPHPHRLSRSQTTCAICLDDFVPRASTVRELPCGHIYHVECIDTSLTQNSSLCPLCKKCVLPPGCWSVPVTNTMVHRDHMLRRSLQ